MPRRSRTPASSCASAAAKELASRQTPAMFTRSTGSWVMRFDQVAQGRSLRRRLTGLELGKQLTLPAVRVQKRAPIRILARPEFVGLARPAGTRWLPHEEV